LLPFLLLLFLFLLETDSLIDEVPTQNPSVSAYRTVKVHSGVDLILRYKGETPSNSVVVVVVVVS